MAVRLACADFSFPLLPHRLALKLIADLGFDGVDLGLFGGGAQLSPETVLANVAESARDLSKKVGDAGLLLADVFLIPGSFDVLAANHPDASERNKSRDLFQRCLEFTHLCEGKHMTALPGIPWKGETLEASQSAPAKNWLGEWIKQRRRGSFFPLSLTWNRLLKRLRRRLPFSTELPG